MNKQTEAPGKEVLNGRYEIIRELGRGTQGRTLLARDLERGGQNIALKELHFGRIQTIKVVELFEREARVLSQISHGAIPAYFEHFFIETHGDAPARYYLAQEFIEGENLRDLIAQGRLFDEQEVRNFLEQLLEILIYLHGQQPPIVHRDLKPSNIMLRQADGAYVLIDFGGVQQQVLTETGSSTVIGTSGYMSPEQMMGRTVPASDLYSLGATAIYLLSHISPSEMQNDGLAIDFRPYVNISEPLARFLERLCSPFVEDRFESSQEALRVLRDLALLASPQEQVPAAVSSGSELFFEQPAEQKAQRRAQLKHLRRLSDPEQGRLLVLESSPRPKNFPAEFRLKNGNLEIYFPKEWPRIARKAIKPLIISISLAGILVIAMYFFMTTELENILAIRSVDEALDYGLSIIGLPFLFVMGLFGVYGFIIQLKEELKPGRVLISPEWVRYTRSYEDVRWLPTQSVERFSILLNHKHKKGFQDSKRKYLMELHSPTRGDLIIDELLTFEEQYHLLGEMREFIYEIKEDPKEPEEADNSEEPKEREVLGEPVEVEVSTTQQW